MPKFRKKPVVIEAFQFVVPMSAGETPPGWLMQAMQSGKVRFSSRGSGAYLCIKTLEGEMEASPNDWVIKGVKGEMYPCKPDIFEATYEPAEG